jgi:hypothetical protein
LVEQVDDVSIIMIADPHIPVIEALKQLQPDLLTVKGGQDPAAIGRSDW